MIVAGLSNEEFASKLRTIPFPFATVGNGDQRRDLSRRAWPVRDQVSRSARSRCSRSAASRTCWPRTPARRWSSSPLSDLKPGSKVQGTTVAELGNHNRPLDMVVYSRRGKDYLLMSNSARGLMKVDLANVATADSITEKIKETAGLPYETNKEITGVEQLDRLDKESALVLVKSSTGSRSLKAIPLP